MSLQTFVTWLTTTAWTDLLGWFGTAEQRVASFLYPILKKSDQIVKSGVLDDVIKLIPQISADIANKDYAELLVDVKQLIHDFFAARDIVMDDNVVSTLAIGAVEQAKAAPATTLAEGA